MWAVKAIRLWVGTLGGPWNLPGWGTPEMVSCKPGEQWKELVAPVHAFPWKQGVTLAICPDDLRERKPWLGTSGNCLGSFSDPLISKSASLPAYRRNGLHRVSKTHWGHYPQAVHDSCIHSWVMTNRWNPDRGFGATSVLTKEPPWEGWEHLVFMAQLLHAEHFTSTHLL